LDRPKRLAVERDVEAAEAAQDQVPRGIDAADRVGVGIEDRTKRGMLGGDERGDVLVCPQPVLPARVVQSPRPGERRVTLRDVRSRRELVDGPGYRHHPDELT